MKDESTRSGATPLIRDVGGFYESYPYPSPIDDIDAYRRAWDDRRRRVETHLVWPAEPYRDNRSILVVGCGTVQAAHYAVRWPRAKVVGIDISATSIAFTQELKRKHGLDNLEVHQLPVERAADLKHAFEYVVCTGVLHHLSDPNAGLDALKHVLDPKGAVNLMVYAPYGRAGVYMLQDYCRRLGIGWSDAEIAELATTLKALPPDHPIAPLLRTSPDFSSKAGMADALLHPQDRSYSVPQLMDLLNRSHLRFGRWVRQAPYLPACGALASTPHRSKLMALPAEAQYAAVELFRGTMLRHSLVAYPKNRQMGREIIEFDSDNWLGYVPIRMPDTITVRDRLPSGAAAVLINRNHTFTDLYLPINAHQERLLGRIDGERSISEICNEPSDRDLARGFFEQLWLWDQVVFDTSQEISKAT